MMFWNSISHRLWNFWRTVAIKRFWEINPMTCNINLHFKKVVWILRISRRKRRCLKKRGFHWEITYSRRLKAKTHHLKLASLPDNQQINSVHLRPSIWRMKIKTSFRTSSTSRTTTRKSATQVIAKMKVILDSDYIRWRMRVEFNQIVAQAWFEKIWKLRIKYCVFK